MPLTPGARQALTAARRTAQVSHHVDKLGDPDPNPNPHQVSHHVDKLVFGAINEAGRLKHVMPIEERSSLFSTSFMMHQVYESSSSSRHEARGSSSSRHQARGSSSSSSSSGVMVHEARGRTASCHSPPAATRPRVLMRRSWQP